MRSIILLLISAASCLGAIAHAGTDTTTFCHAVATCPSTKSPTQHNMVVVSGWQASYSTPGIALASVTDNGSGGSSTYTQIINAQGSGIYDYYFLFVACDVKASVTTITINPNATIQAATTDLSVIVQEFSGASTTSCNQNASTQQTAAGTTSLSCCALTPSITGEVGIGIAANITNGTNTLTGTSGYTCANVHNTNFDLEFSACYLIISGTGSQTFTGTISGSSTYEAYQALFLPPSASASTRSRGFTL